MKHSLNAMAKDAKRQHNRVAGDLQYAACESAYDVIRAWRGGKRDFEPGSYARYVLEIVAEMA